MQRPAPGDPLRPVPDTDRPFLPGSVAEIVSGRRATIVPVFDRTFDTAVEWTLPGGQKLAPGESFDQTTVLENGTLVIRNAQSSDSGDYGVVVTFQISPTVNRTDSATTPLNVVGN